MVKSVNELLGESQDLIFPFLKENSDFEEGLPSMKKIHTLVCCICENCNGGDCSEKEKKENNPLKKSFVRSITPVCDKLKNKEGEAKNADEFFFVYVLKFATYIYCQIKNRRINIDALLEAGEIFKNNEFLSEELKNIVKLIPQDFFHFAHELARKWGEKEQSDLMSNIIVSAEGIKQICEFSETKEMKRARLFQKVQSTTSLILRTCDYCRGACGQIIDFDISYPVSAESYFCPYSSHRARSIFLQPLLKDFIRTYNDEYHTEISEEKLEKALEMSLEDAASFPKDLSKSIRQVPYDFFEALMDVSVLWRRANGGSDLMFELYIYMLAIYTQACSSSI